MKKIAGYVRVSTQEQASGYGPDTQRHKIEHWADLHDIPETELFEDLGISGAKKSRPALDEMLGRLDEFDAVVVFKADRLSRDLTHMMELIRYKLEKTNTALVSVTEQFDTSTPWGRAAVQMLGVFAELERSLINERMMEGRKQSAQQGNWAGGRPPYGYDAVEGELVPNDDMETVEWILYMKDEEGMTLRAIAEELNRAGYDSPRGGEWHLSSVAYVVKNEKYRGVMRQRIGGEEFVGACTPA